jgi:hypothetical protein
LKAAAIAPEETERVWKQRAWPADHFDIKQCLYANGLHYCSVYA